MAMDMSRVEKFGVLFGYPIAHSYSPLMHQTVYDSIGYNWRQFLLESMDMSEFLELMQHPKFYGMSHHRLQADMRNPSIDSVRGCCHNAPQGRNTATS